MKIEELDNYLKQKNYSQLFILTDGNTSEHCLPVFLDYAPDIADMPNTILEIGGGEDNKTMDTVIDIIHTLVECKADRHTCIICLGGGIICDIGGFVCSVYKRGIDCVYIPTTLLCMADASVGGKTAVNFGNIKNLIGTFNSDITVFYCKDFLSTLDKNQIMCGVAEILKIFILFDKQYFEELIELNDFSDIDKKFIFRAIELKQEVIKKDFCDKNERQYLNLGHTLGHAIESYFNENKEYFNKQNITLPTHGHCVAMGLYYITLISKKLCGLPDNQSEMIIKFIKRHYYIHPLEDCLSQITQYILQDKKNQNSNIRFILLNGITKPVMVEISDGDLEKFLLNYK